MNRRKFLIVTCASMLVIALMGIGPPVVQAIDETKIPHYYGPYPNWALSQLPVVTPGACSTTSTTACTTDAGCPAGETCVGVTVSGGIKKFQDGLPGLCDPKVTGSCDAARNNLGQYIPLAVPDTTTFTTEKGFTDNADYYVIAVVQHRERMSSSLPGSGTLLREYVQLETPANASWSKHVPLRTDLPDGTSVPTLMPDKSQAYAVEDPHYLGPVIVATKNRPIRIVFYNLLPIGTGGNLFLPVDSSIMGSGMGQMMDPYDPTPMMGGDVYDMARNPMCTDGTKGTNDNCFKDNRATIHLHGGISPWISDGTVHQWITPANENTPWQEGVGVNSVPDMVGVSGVPDCSAPNDGCMAFYYTNQQSARLMFYHDHSWGITRLNVYAGEAAGYLITDETEKKLIADGTIPGPADTIPLVIQDRTFVPDTAQMTAQDPTWDYSRWGKKGDLWYHHVYMPAENPNDPGGTSAYGRWFYGPWFWPPARDAKYGPIINPYYNMDPNTSFTTPLAKPCSLDDPSTWQYQVDPFCEPPVIPGTPNISAGMEQFNDTPIVNGTAYPTTTVEPKPYRLRILNAANDRFFNLQWYLADATGTEVALKAAEVAAAQEDPNVFPTPDTALSPAGPSWIQIGTEGGFLPAPVVIPNQPITWVTDPARFDVGNVDKHSLLLGNAERADVIVDFSPYAGKTLILYNDAPAAFPARVASYDYYTGTPNLSPVGAPYILPGYGPNTRTIMQVKVADIAPAPAFNQAALDNAFKSTKLGGGGVFESGQHPIIVGQAAYNSAYGTHFAANQWCNPPNVPGVDIQICDGLPRIWDQGGDLFGFNTLFSPNAKVQIPIEPKAMHDETNASTFDEYGRMQANLGIEAAPATPGLQNINLMPFVFPPTEVIDATNLPKGDLQVTPIATQDGTQIWKITHNGVDTHPIHFHLYDVQLLSRAPWDGTNLLIPDANELGWKETIRISPLEDTYIALRPIIPVVPFDMPNSIRPLNPMLPDGAPIALASVADALGIGIPPSNPAGEPVDIYNHYVNFGAEYVYHCHILSHEEMDMMRPVAVALPPVAPSDLTAIVSGNGPNRKVVLAWTDRSLSETGFVVQRSTTASGPWIPIATLASSTGPTTGGSVTYGDPVGKDSTQYAYRVQAINVVGDTWNYADPNINEIVSGGFPTVTASSGFTNLAFNVPPPSAPTNLTASLVAGPQINLMFTDTATNETGFMIERSIDGGSSYVQIASLPANKNTGSVTYADTTVGPSTADTSYTYRVAAMNIAGLSGVAVSNTVVLPAVPTAPGSFTATNGPNGPGNNRSVNLNWSDLSNNETGFTIERATDAGFTSGLSTATVAPNSTAFTQTGLSRNTSYYYRIQANNGPFVSSAWVNATPVPIITNP